MRKIPPNFESHIDNILYVPIEYLSDYMKDVHPNILTTIAVLCDIFAFYSCYICKFALSVVLFFFGYFFDCMDGYVARKFKKVSKFGDYYDHVTDTLKVIGMLVVFYILNPTYFYKLLPLLFTMVILVVIHLDLQEITYNKRKESDTLGVLSLVARFIHGNNKDLIVYTRYFGLGNMFVVLLLIYIYVINNSDYYLSCKHKKNDL